MKLKAVRRAEYYKRRVKPDFAPITFEPKVVEREEWNNFFRRKQPKT